MGTHREVIRENPTASYELRWDATDKRWLLSWRVTVGKGNRSQWMWLDSSQPIDEFGAQSIARALVAEIDRWLPFY